MTRGNFRRKGHPFQSIRTFCRELCRNGWTDRLAFALRTRVGWRMHKLIIFAMWRHSAHMGGHIGTTWRIRFNHRPSAAAMRSYVKLLWPLVVLAQASFLAWLQVGLVSIKQNVFWRPDAIYVIQTTVLKGWKKLRSTDLNLVKSAADLRVGYCIVSAGCLSPLTEWWAWFNVYIIKWYCSVV